MSCNRDCILRGVLIRYSFGRSSKRMLLSISSLTRQLLLRKLMNIIRNLLLNKHESDSNNNWHTKGLITRNKMIIIMSLWMKVLNFKNLEIWKINRPKLLLRASLNSKLNKIEPRRLLAEKIEGPHKDGVLPLVLRPLKMFWSLKT